MGEQMSREEAQKRVGETKEFYTHLVVYVVVISALVVANLLASPGYIWFIWPLLGWGLGVLLHGASTFGWFRSK
jgi:hypothetical protein